MGFFDEKGAIAELMGMGASAAFGHSDAVRTQRDVTGSLTEACSSTANTCGLGVRAVGGSRFVHGAHGREVIAFGGESLAPRPPAGLRASALKGALPRPRVKADRRRLNDAQTTGRASRLRLDHIPQVGVRQGACHTKHKDDR
jgi:hypothetical protein